ncbi:hypothetical protein G9C98_000815 [Cotesia typhae]|uniref:Uncharacterized protein n=1 Tax=Cotesia typhae TaxID=2053667 RepID=A0A8J5UW64_9HYME|nr:hypothetical protein G9C98_000815 [Cotesia typhae]
MLIVQGWTGKSVPSVRNSNILSSPGQQVCIRVLQKLRGGRVSDCELEPAEADVHASEVQQQVSELSGLKSDTGGTFDPSDSRIKATWRTIDSYWRTRLPFQRVRPSLPRKNSSDLASGSHVGDPLRDERSPLPDQPRAVQVLRRAGVSGVQLALDQRTAHSGHPGPKESLWWTRLRLLRDP